MRRHAIVRLVVSPVLCWALASAPALANAAPTTPPKTAPAKPTTTAAPTSETPPPADATTPPPAGTPTDPGTVTADPNTTPPAEPGTEPTGEPTGETTPEEPPTEAPPAEEPPAEEPKEEVKPEEPPPPDPYANRPDEPRISGKPRKGKGMMIAGGTVLGASLAATITFGMITQHCSYNGPLECRLQDQDKFLLPLGGAGILLGAMILGVGVGYHVGYKRWEDWTPEKEAARQAKRNKNKRKKAGAAKTALAPAMFRGGGGVAVFGRF